MPLRPFAVPEGKQIMSRLLRSERSQPVPALLLTPSVCFEPQSVHLQLSPRPHTFPASPSLPFHGKQRTAKPAGLPATQTKLLCVPRLLAQLCEGPVTIVSGQQRPVWVRTPCSRSRGPWFPQSALSEVSWLCICSNQPWVRFLSLSHWRKEPQPGEVLSRG